MENEKHVQHNNKLLHDFFQGYGEDTGHTYSTFLFDVLYRILTDEEPEDLTDSYKSEVIFKFLRLNELLTGLKCPFMETRWINQSSEIV